MRRVLRPISAIAPPATSRTARASRGAIPALAGNTSVQSEGPETVIRIILGGLAAQNGYAPMPAVGAGMTDREVADVTDYIRNAWGNNAPVIAERGIVTTARAATQTMLAGTAPCAEIAQPEVAKAIADAGSAESLKGLAPDNFVPVIDSLLPKVKAAAGGAKDDDIVNGLTTVFCQTARHDPAHGKIGWHAVIGSFSSVVYSQIRNPEKRVALPAPAGVAPTP